MYVYGGHEYNLGIFSDFHKINVSNSATTYNWVEIPKPKKLDESPSLQAIPVVYPGPRARHTAIVHDDKMYLYGGLKNSTENTSEFWAFDFKEQTWSPVESVPDSALPPSLDSHSADLWIPEENNAMMIVFGGFIGGERGELSNHVLSFNFASQRWETLWENQASQKEEQTPLFPAQRMCHGSCIHDNKLYIFGGADEDSKFGDLWCFDLNAKTWQLLSAEGESPEVTLPLIFGLSD